MKKLVSVLLAVFLLAGVLTGCGNNPTGKNEKLSVVTTIFPEYDWVMNVLGEQADDVTVTMLLDNGVDLHSYQPTAADMIRISSCDLFVYVGGESDRWVADALKEATNKNMVVINLLEVLGDAVREEELVEGMQGEEEEEDAEEGPEYDEHVWLSLKNAATLVGAIRDALTKLDAPHAQAYQDNAAAYLEKLRTLDEKYQSAVNEAPHKTLLFGDRFPFRYLTEDYGLSYYAAFVGCSAESEASFETIAFLAKKLDELALPAVLTLEGSDQKIAQTILATSVAKNARILSLDSMQSTTSGDVRQGTTYLSVMEKNLKTLTQALQ